MRRSSDWDNIGLSCRLNRLNKHSRWDKWQDKVSFCSLIRFNWRVPARVPLFSLGLKAPRSGPCGHSGRLSEVVLTHYRRREVRNSIYRYRKIHIDYRSKFSYRFISFISIIYGNTKNKCADTSQSVWWTDGQSHFLSWKNFNDEGPKWVNSSFPWKHCPTVAEMSRAWQTAVLPNSCHDSIRIINELFYQYFGAAHSNLLNLTFLSIKIYLFDHHKILHMPRQLCCCGMCKILR